MNQTTNTLAALWVSEIWQSMWDMRDLLKNDRNPIYYKCRSVVVYDRVMREG